MDDPFEEIRRMHEGITTAEEYTAQAMTVLERWQEDRGGKLNSTERKALACLRTAYTALEEAHDRLAPIFVAARIEGPTAIAEAPHG